MDNFRDDPEAWKIMAVLELENEPAHTVEHATALLRRWAGRCVDLCFAGFRQAKIGAKWRCLRGLEPGFERLADWNINGSCGPEN